MKLRWKAHKVAPSIGMNLCTESDRMVICSKLTHAIKSSLGQTTDEKFLSVKESSNQYPNYRQFIESNLTSGGMLKLKQARRLP